MDASQGHRDQPFKGIVLMLIAVMAFAFMDLGVKLLVERYSALQVSFIRLAGSLPVFTLGILISGNLKHFRTAYPGWQLTRALMGIALLTAVGICFRELPLADAYALFFASPLVIALLSGPLLSEPAGRHRIVAAWLGFLGILIMLAPGSAGVTMGIGVIMGLVGMIIYSLTTLIMRHLTRKDSALTISFYFTFFGTLASAVLVLPNWTPIDPRDYWVIAMLVASGSLAQYLLSYAFRLASPSTLAPFDYTSMIWALILGFWLWGAIPGWRMLLGTVIIIASGLYIIHRERVRNLVRKADGPTPP